MFDGWPLRLQRRPEYTKQMTDGTDELKFSGIRKGKEAGRVGKMKMPLFNGLASLSELHLRRRWARLGRGN